jgi:hypothetical protein
MKCGLFIGLHAGDTGHILREGLFESLLTAPTVGRLTDLCYPQQIYNRTVSCRSRQCRILRSVFVWQMSLQALCPFLESFQVITTFLVALPVRSAQYRIGQQAWVYRSACL